jgi:hypothetical protein
LLAFSYCPPGSDAAGMINGDCIARSKLSRGICTFLWLGCSCSTIDCGTALRDVTRISISHFYSVHP